LDGKAIAMMGAARDIEWRLVPTEAMALLLEASLIREYRPKYNISLRDDKSFPYVKMTNEDFPCIYVTRKKENDGARYFGPYTSAGLLREALKIIRKTFPYRSCRNMPNRPCIYYRLNLSPAPCAGKISRKAYRETLSNIAMLLDGKTESLVKELAGNMHKMAEKREYEEAARIRDQINTLSSISSSQANPSGLNELEDIKSRLGLKHLPLRIEAFDISNIQGQEAVGSMVSFYKAVSDKNNYRRFKIKTVRGIDDYKMMAEVVSRRYSRMIEDKLPMPDLILIDGGKAHLCVAKRELDKLKLKIPVISIAKKEENIYTSGMRLKRISEGAAALNLIRRIRDEAHRFALSYHHLLRRKKLIDA
jgi:excinuclease ABC subunit C